MKRSYQIILKFLKWKYKRKDWIREGKVLFVEQELWRQIGEEPLKVSDSNLSSMMTCLIKILIEIFRWKNFLKGMMQILEKYGLRKALLWEKIVEIFCYQSLKYIVGNAKRLLCTKWQNSNFESYFLDHSLIVYFKSTLCAFFFWQKRLGKSRIHTRRYSLLKSFPNVM